MNENKSGILIKYHDSWRFEIRERQVYQKQNHVFFAEEYRHQSLWKPVNTNQIPDFLTNITHDSRKIPRFFLFGFPTIVEFVRNGPKLQQRRLTKIYRPWECSSRSVLLFEIEAIPL